MVHIDHTLMPKLLRYISLKKITWLIYRNNNLGKFLSDFDLPSRLQVAIL